jgi:hypothetical protein
MVHQATKGTLVKQMTKKKWQTPEVKVLTAGSAENLSKNGNDGGTGANRHISS